MQLHTRVYNYKRDCEFEKEWSDIRVVGGQEGRGKIMQILYSYEVLKFEKER